MIVRRAGSTLYLITQPDHAALAGRIMRHWRPLHNADRRASILHAIEEHDNGWREADEAPTVDPGTGRIHDFITAPAHVRQGVWPRGIARLADDPWAAALVAQHAMTVYDRYHADPEWQRFFAALAVIRDQLIMQASLGLDQLTHDYAYVRIGDLISLIFCHQWDEERYGAWSFRRDRDQVMVTPDPFEGRRIPIAVTARQIPDARYDSDGKLNDTLRTAPVVMLKGIVSGNPLNP